jgi:hypothetical protein
MSEEMGFQIECSDYEVKLLLYAIEEAIRVWPGSRSPKEQEDLKELRQSFRKMVLEMTWEKES